MLGMLGILGISWAKASVQLDSSSDSKKVRFTSRNSIGWVVVEPTHLKNMLVKLDHFPKKNWVGENKKRMKPS